MTKTIKHQFFFPHPNETVWEYLTKPELLEQWLMKNDFQPVVGHDFQFRTNPIPGLDFDGICHCKVLEIVPFQKLSYSWKAGSGNGEFSLDTLVVWKLVSNDKGTDLFLEHSGFGKTEHANFFPGMTDGWLKNVQKIKNLLNTAQHDTTKA
jgi:uncharacterized protein YndB with AHSA1/START domain